MSRPQGRHTYADPGRGYSGTLPPHEQSVDPGTDDVTESPPTHHSQVQHASLCSPRLPRPEMEARQGPHGILIK